MWQRKQTVFLIVAVVLTVICLCMQIGAFSAAGLDVAKVYNLWFTDPIGKRHFDVWPLMAILLPTAALGTYTIFIYHNRKAVCAAANSLAASSGGTPVILPLIYTFIVYNSFGSRRN